MQASSSFPIAKPPKSTKWPADKTNSFSSWARSKSAAVSHIYTPTVSIKYQGLKATQYFSKFTDDSTKTLLLDLTELKLPHPKRHAIVFISHGLMQFSWPRDKASQVLMKNLRNRINPENPLDKEAINAKLKKLSIASLTLQETPVKDFGVKAHAWKTTFGPPLDKLPVEIHNNTNEVRKRKHSAIYHATPPPPLFSGSEMQSFPDSIDLDARAEKRPKLTTAPREIEQVHTSSDSIALSEPSRHISIPSSPGSQRGRTDSIASSVASRGAPLPLETRVSQDVFPPSSHSAPQILRPIGSTYPDRSSASAVEPPFSPTAFAPAASAALLADTMSLDLLPSGYQTSSQHPTSLNTQLQPSSSYTITTSSPNGIASIPQAQSSPPPQPPSSTTAHAAAGPFSPPPSTTVKVVAFPFKSRPLNAATYPLSTTARLKNDLETVRARIAQGITREEEIIKALKMHGAADGEIPDSMLSSSSKAADAERALISTHLREVERQLEAERRQRREAEDTLRDIERECRAPFVVPALLQAFISISKLTSQAMRS